MNFEINKDSDVIIRKHINHISRASKSVLSNKKAIGGVCARNTVTASRNEKEFSKQVSGFSFCLSVLLKTEGIYWNLSKSYEFLFSQLSQYSLDQLPKVFKFSLAYYFSKNLKQQKPEASFPPIILFNKNIQDKVTKVLKKSKTARLKFLWNLLQCKDLANKIPNEMIPGAYEKHRAALTTVANTPESILDFFKNYLHEFGKEVSRVFSNKTFLPPQKGYLNSPRSGGGCRSALKDNIKFRGSYTRNDNSLQRMDPVVIHLAGQPGVGKSYLTNKVSSKLQRAFGLINSQYSRSLATDHWDGYRNQLVAIIDDVFQLSIHDEDILQVIELCSNVDLVLPMADLREKGRKFNSEFLILTSNHPHLAADMKSINDPWPLNRRIYPLYYIKSFSKKTRLYEVEYHTYEIPRSKELLTFIRPEIVKKQLRSMNEADLIQLIFDEAMTKFVDRSTESNYFQYIDTARVHETGLGIQYSSFPPSEIPTVQAHAIAEPLKVRMITKGEPESWVLKPVQKAMFQAMKKFPCFELTSGMPINLDRLTLNEKFLLSGDYEAATDNLHIDIIRTAISILKDYIPNEVLRRYMEWEGGPHWLTYPKSTGFDTCLQTNGQLMGSLLSFPILCIANATTIGMALSVPSLMDVPALINGDDILFCSNQKTITKWKKISSSMGLKPSIGKNYQSEYFGSINSQLILRNTKTNEWTQELTGKFSCLVRGEGETLTAAQSLRVHPIGLVVSMQRALLKQTPQSLEIPVQYGGLGDVFRRENSSLLDNELYFWKLLDLHCKLIMQVGDELLVRMPKNLYKKFQNVVDMRQINNPYDMEIFDLPEKDENQIFDWRKFHNFQKFYKSVPHLRERIRSANLKNECPLNLLKSDAYLLPLKYKSFINNIRDRV